MTSSLSIYLPLPLCPLSSSSLLLSSVCSLPHYYSWEQEREEEEWQRQRAAAAPTEENIIAVTGGGREMYAEAGLPLPAFSQGCFFQRAAAGDYRGHCPRLSLLSDDNFLGNMVQAPTVSEYDMGGEGDLFKAPEPILEERALELDPMTAAISIISGGGDVITETIKVADMESIQNDHLTDIFYEYKDLLEKSQIKDSISELLDIKIPAVQLDEIPALEKLSYEEGSMQKSVSSGCLNSVEWISSCSMRLEDLLDFQGLDFEAAFGMRRAYSEGDIQNLGNKNTSIGSTTAVCSSFEQLLTISDLKTERQQKLSRYREKKSKRNFGKKIKYACRKALADSQPRVRGRFARTEEVRL